MSISSSKKEIDQNIQASVIDKKGRILIEERPIISLIDYIKACRLLATEKLLIKHESDFFLYCYPHDTFEPIWHCAFESQSLLAIPDYIGFEENFTDTKTFLDIETLFVLSKISKSILNGIIKFSNGDRCEVTDFILLNTLAMGC